MKISGGGFVLVFALVAGAVFGQGTQTATLSGSVESRDGQPIPGATVTAKSPALIGIRSAVADTHGAYIFKGLPAGEYTLTFQATGMGTVELTKRLEVGSSATVDATLKLATVEETIVVTADAPTALVSPSGGAQYTSEQVDALANSRTLVGIAELSPGLTDNTPNGGQVTISGSFAYDNVFLIDGVDVNDNLFGSPDNLFIEDAIDEVQVLTSGISAEYGRFGGGIVNAVTKRGGNAFAGSFRTDLTNPAWKDETPFEEAAGTQHEDILGKIHQVTLGGPIVRERLWFFTAARRERSSTAQALRETAEPYNVDVSNDRLEGKLTGNVDPSHSLQASFTRNQTRQRNRPSIDTTFSMDRRTLVDRTLPNHLFVLSYNGVLRSNLFAEAQYSQKKLGFRNAGGTGTDLRDSPFISTQTGAVRHYNAPYFDNNDPENRNNRQLAGSLSYFLSRSDWGKHDLKWGGEHFTSTLTGGNSQSSTGYVYDADFKVDAAGKPVTDADGRIIPVFDADNPRTRLESWIPVRNARVDIRTLSLYLNDRWTLNQHWAFNLGVRFEAVDSEATGGITTVDTSAIVPRLAVSFDPRGDGLWRFDATFGRYAGKYSESQFANTNVGNADYLGLDYVGPKGEGLGFAPGLDPRNYVVDEGDFPTANVKVAKDVRSPLTQEITLGAGRQVLKGGYVKAVYTRRTRKHFVEDFTTIDNGTTTVERDGVLFGTFDNVLIGNTDVMKRDYQGLQLVSHLPLTDRWDLTAHWTMQLRNHGNFEGEASNQPGISSPFGDHPEFRSEERHYPVGRLDDFQRHKGVLYTTYRQPLGRMGDVTAGLTWRYESALTYSHTVTTFPRTPQQSALDPGYATPMSTQTIFFGTRGENELAGYHVFHLALGYGVPVWRSVRPWVKVEARNLLNNDARIGWDRTISPVTTGPVDSLGLPTTFTKGPRYGTATSLAHHPSAREVMVSLGVRF
jgi:hypothetical protein